MHTNIFRNEYLQTAHLTHISCHQRQGSNHNNQLLVPWLWCYFLVLVINLVLVIVIVP